MILGIDPGYDRCGWAIVTKTPLSLSLVACGLIETKKQDEHATRLVGIADGIRSVIEQYHPTKAVVEKLFFSTNVKTALPVAEARGVILLECARARLAIQELTPKQIKSQAAGDGSANKQAVEKMVRLQVKKIPEKLIDDVIDAIAVAIAS